MTLSGAQVFTTEVAASVPVCFATITDFERYPEWFSAVHETRLLERYRDGLGKRVEFRVDMKLTQIRYVLAYEYDQPRGLSWEAVEGDLEAIRGDYRFEKLAPSLTRATCRQAVAIGFWVPGPMRAAMEAHALRHSVLELKAAAEAVARAAGRTRRRG